MLHGQPYKRLRERDVADFLVTLPQPVAALIGRMTAPVADDRYREMADVAEAIRRIEQILDLDIAAPIAPAPALPPPTVTDAEKAAVPPAETAIPVRPIAVPSNPTPDGPIVATHTPTTQSAAQHLARPITSDGEIAVVTAEHTQKTPTSEGRSELVAALPFPLPARSFPVARGARVALVGVLLAVLVIGGIGSAFRLSGGRGGGLATATAPEPAVGALTLDTVAASAIASPTASAIVAPLFATATSAPTTTIAPTPQPTVVPTSTVTAVPPTATAMPPTATPVPSLGVFGVGTTDRGDLESLSPADAVDTFTVGQDVFAFVNYDGARPGVDTFDITLIANDAAQPPQTVTLQKTGGFAFVSLGKPGVGTYRIEVRHGGALLPNQPTFQVKSPAPTPVPVSAPRATAAPVSQPQPAQQPAPAAQPKAPTCVPGTC
jgi:hypothetical protein